MTAIILPFKAKEPIGKFVELTPEAQQAVMAMIDALWKARGQSMPHEEFRTGMIELLENGKAWFEKGPMGFGMVIDFEAK